MQETPNSVIVIPYPRGATDMIPKPKLLDRLSLSSLEEAIVLVGCGSFSPITFQHLRMFEEIRGFLDFNTPPTAAVVAGYLSPVHDAYGKSGLASAAHRRKMCALAVQKSDWMDVATWECEQKGWTPTDVVLQAFKDELKQYFPESTKITVKLVAGADLVESFKYDSVWTPEVRRKILGEFGVACIDRSGVKLEEFVRSEPVLREFSENIIAVTPSVRNDVSSSAVRKLLKEGKSATFLLPTKVLAYIEENELYECKKGTQHLQS